MSVAGGLDVRLPIGGLFTLLGILIGGYGMTTAGDAARYARSAAVNINLWWGLVMLAFGLLLLFLGWRRHTAAVHPALETPEGRLTEIREHELGLERERR
jgi:membrane protein implicated in regulation of membrane protease activity